MFVYLCKFINIKIKKKYKNYYFLKIRDLRERWASLQANYKGELEKLEDIKKAKLDEIRERGERERDRREGQEREGEVTYFPCMDYLFAQTSPSFSQVPRCTCRGMLRTCH